MTGSSDIVQDIFAFNVGDDSNSDDTATLRLVVKSRGQLKDVVACSPMNLRALALYDGTSWCFNLSS